MDTQEQDDPSTVEAFEKATMGIENPTFFKSAKKQSSNFLTALIFPSGSNNVVPDPAGSSSSPIRVPIVPAACYAITEIDSEVLPDNPTGFGYD